MPANMDYNSLSSDIRSYMERPDDDALLTQIPRLVMMAENRLATDTKILGTQKVVTATLTPGDPTLPKPSYWRNTVSFNVTVPGTGLGTGRKDLLLRTYEFCRTYWPDPTLTGVPRYYSDYNYANFFLVPTPTLALPMELVHYVRLDPLSPSNTNNWFTDNAPQLLLLACLVETQLWLKNLQQATYWEGRYNTSLSAFMGEDAKRSIDRNEAVS